MALMQRPKTRPGPARFGLMDGGAFEVSEAMDGRRQLRNDWLILLHHACIARQRNSYSMYRSTNIQKITTY